ncbi:molybdopterin-guanine dinucleotide biosynthesis protein A [Solimonas aquatica]|uniref:Molybdenum cofactor guanylyltransferase n=1 Tax=Solimonas aquatica TaxID=489703 RepID=A0A1H9D458_9GAMM|nr:molybdenum cofactor guanylyltransferase MobA [Solimonas aquatica]SEQ08161.1 molybdopterin-guanine dinucleotide biosynthesis protein A [Solimonas aquatica]
MSRPAPTAENITALILAGGRGTRMQGADKGLVELAGKPLVLHVLEALRAQVGSVRINANRNAERYAQLTKLPVCADLREGYEGPLAGIEAGFAASSTPWLLAVPCDTPGLPADLVAQLGAGLQNAAAPAAYAQAPDGPVYPLCLVSRALAPALRGALDAGERAVGRWLQAQQALAVPIRGWPLPMSNLNTPERLAAAEAMMRG